MATNQIFTQGNVTLKSGETSTLSASQMALRAKNLKTQGIDANSTTAGTTGGAVNQTTAPTSGTPSTEQDTNQSIDAVQTTQQEVIQSQKDAFDYNKGLEDKINENLNTNQAEADRLAQEKINNANSYYNQNEQLIKQQNQEIQAIEQSQLQDYQNRISRDTALLEEKKNSETTYLKAQAEKQRLDNEKAVRDAKFQVEIQRQQSAWGYNKIGLGFSSGVINQSQQIATEGIAKIAEIKANMNLGEAQMVAKIADVEFNYASLVNKTIDTYVDKIDSTKKDMKNRIIETNKNLILNSYSKKEKITEIEDWARTERMNAERQHIQDIQAVKDKGIQYLKDVEESILKYQNRELGKLDTMLQNGTIMSLSPQQVAQKESELGLPTGTINAQVDNAINTEIRNMFDTLAGKGAIIGDITNIRESVKQEIKMGRTYDDAVNIVMERELKTNKELQNAIAEKNKPSLEERKYQLDVYKAEQDAQKDNRNYNLDVKKLELDQAYKSGQISLDTYKAETGRMGINLDYAKLSEDQRQFNAEKGGLQVNDYSNIGVGDSFMGFPITQTFGTKGGPNSKDTGANGGTPGVDIAMPEGTPLQSFVSGEVTFVGQKGDYGTQVEITDENGNKHMYSHLNGANVQMGAKVGVGDSIGLSGNSGFSTGAHLDYRVKGSSGWIDPRQYMNGIEVAQSEERKILESKAVELGLDRGDVSLVNNGDLTSYIKTNTKRGAISDVTKPLLTQLEKDVNSDNAKTAYESLLKDGFTKEEALNQIAQLKEITVKNGVIYDKDLIKDDPIFNTNTN